jgi:hypothetical protein
MKKKNVHVTPSGTSNEHVTVRLFPANRVIGKPISQVHYMRCIRFTSISSYRYGARSHFHFHPRRYAHSMNRPTQVTELGGLQDEINRVQPQVGLQHSNGRKPPCLEVSRSHTHTPGRHRPPLTEHTTDARLCPQLESNPRFQQ